MKINKILQTLSLILLLHPSSFAQKQLEMKDILRSFYDFSLLPVYTDETYSSQESSYDRKGMNDDGFGGAYSYVRRNADSSLVIFDVKGAGVINRFWTPTPTDDSLEFYIDNEVTPTLKICYRDLFSGKVYPFVAPLCANQLGGFYCYLPIPFNSSCKIVLRGKFTRFHQIGYRLYEKGTTIKPFTTNFTEDEKQGLEKVKNLWNKQDLLTADLYGTPFKTSKNNISISPSQTITVYETRQPGRIIGFEILSAADINAAARNIDLRITYDDEKTPAVYCPLSDYFGYSFGKASMKGLLAGSDGKRHYSWFPMPFDKSIKIELVYRSMATKNELNTIHVLCKTYTSGKKRNAQTEGKFYAHWNRENPVPTGKPYTMLDIKGRGHFAGVVLQAQGLVAGITGYFEGDDSTVVDGKMRMHGTGSEDFFNGGWYALLDCWDDAMSMPLSGALDYSIPLARTGGYRFFLTDKIGFNKTFLQTIEHGPEHNRWPADYTSVSYFYGSQTNSQRVMPNNGNTKIFTPDTLEIYSQLMFVAIDEYCSVEAKWMNILPAKTVFYTIQDNSLVKMSLSKIPAGTYKIYLDYYKGADVARFSVWQRQSQITDWIDGYDATSGRVDKQEIGKITISALNNSFSFRFKTITTRNKFILNRIVLVKEK